MKKSRWTGLKQRLQLAVNVDDVVNAGRNEKIPLDGIETIKTFPGVVVGHRALLVETKKSRWTGLKQ